MRYYILIVSICYMSIISKAQEIDIQGHRGARGKMPENTLPAFIYALDQGVTTLELDVVISKDKQVVVSHEPWMDPTKCYQPNDSKLKEDFKEAYNIYRLNYSEIKQFDCGTVPSSRFPEQIKMKAVKPLLVDVIKAVERHTKGVTHYEVNYNIEIKSVEKTDEIFHPNVKEFSDLVFETVDQYLPWERVIIQSFDIRVLQYWHKKHPTVTLAYLTEELKSIESTLDELGFTPDIYSPDYQLLTKSKVDKIHSLNIEVIPWTVNDKSVMRKLVSWRVDGLITDYPDRAALLGLTRKIANDK